MIDMQAIRDDEIKKLSVALQSYRDAAARHRAIAAFWHDSNLPHAEANRDAALKLADEADNKASDIEAFIRSIESWSKQEQTRAKHRIE